MNTAPFTRRRRRGVAGAPGALFRYVAGDSLAGATFTRASAATYRDVGNVRQSAISGVARDGHYIGGRRHVLLEQQRTNLLLNSTAPATQTVASMVAGTYTLWVEGTGSCALSGGPVGTASAGAPVTFTLGATTSVTFTITGSVTAFQCETGGYVTSLVITTVAAATRATDTLVLPHTAAPGASAWYVDTVPLEPFTGSQPNLIRVGAAGTPPVGALVYDSRWVGAVTMVGSNAAADVNPSGFVIGDRVQGYMRLLASGFMRSGLAVNGGAATEGADSASAVVYPGAWSAASITLAAATSAAIAKVVVYSDPLASLATLAAA
jgi:hypothetical protein